MIRQRACPLCCRGYDTLGDIPCLLLALGQSGSFGRNGLPAMSPWPTSASPLSWLSALLGDIPDGTTVAVLGREFWGLFGLSKMENYKGLRIT